MTITSAAPLEAVLGRFGNLLIAFSGGVDSGVLLAVAARVLGPRVVALTTDSASMPRHELEEAVSFARTLGVRHLVRQSSELDRDEYARNDRDRCFFCKQTLFEVCAAAAAAEGIHNVAYGYTADDAHDFRPGHRAAVSAGIHAPLHEAGLGKSAIRAIAREMSLSLADKPAAPCLSSRIPYGSAVTTEKLQQIESMEDLLREFGFREFRARYDGTLMRIELPPEEIPRAVEADARRRILARARDIGVKLVTIDLEGFRSGKLNER